MKKLNKKGFTLIELVIVIAVIAILAAVLIPTFTNIIQKANESNALTTGSSFYQELFAADLSDGKLDEKDGNVALGSSDTWKDAGYTLEVPKGGKYTYNVAEGKVSTYTFTINGYTVTRAENGTFTVGAAAE